MFRFFHILLVYGGCGSFLDDFLSIANATDYCINKGEGCFEEVGDYEGAPLETACCCKGNMWVKMFSIFATTH